MKEQLFLQGQCHFSHVFGKLQEYFLYAHFSPCKHLNNGWIKFILFLAPTVDKELRTVAPLHCKQIRAAVS